MASIADRQDFFPPKAQGTGRAMSFALLAHLALLGALTWGVSWKREATVTTVEAELWSSLPQQAAPKLVEAAAPPPQPKAETPPEPPAPKAPDIAVEKEKPKPPAKVEAKPESKPEPKPTPKPEPKVDKAPERRKQAERDKAEADKRIQEQLNRANAMANASGAPNSPGTAQQASSMAAGWDARVKARVNPQITYSGDRAALKDLELSISILPDGTISGRPRITKSSGSAQWDEAVARAFEKAESLPRDASGKLPPSPFRLIWIAKE
jgi:colicin import membrane protein